MPGPTLADEAAPAPSGASGPASESGRRPIEPLGPEFGSIQPGGGLCMEIELAWGRLRRGLLRALRPGAVARRRAARAGEAGKIPFEPIDSRDLKYYRNVSGYRWEGDRFAWRERIPFARPGLAELVLFAGGFLAIAAALAALWWPAAAAPAIAAGLVFWFFRDPERRPPADPAAVVSPADGKVVEVARLEHDETSGGPAVRIGIFLSVFDVHVNRAPIAGRAIGMRYRRGRYRNALSPESARENEALEIRIEASERPHRLVTVRQIAGAVARRIVCWPAPGEELGRGERYGMIKFGSRTELTLPAEGLEVLTRVGDRVRGGETAVARYAGAGRETE